MTYAFCAVCGSALDLDGEARATERCPSCGYIGEPYVQHDLGLWDEPCDDEDDEGIVAH